MKKILIAGGGISGLVARYYLSKRFPESEIVLFEKSGQLGGCVQSDHKEFFFERGPRTFKASRSEALIALIKELGLEGEMVHSSKASNRRYILKEGKLRSPLALAWKMLPALTNEWRKPYPWEGDESIEAFVSRRLGSYAAETFFDPLTLGIYAGDIRKLSIKSCFSGLKALEMEYGSLTRGLLKSPKKKKPKGLFTLNGGLSLLIETLAKKGRGEIRLNQGIHEPHEGFDHHVLALPLKGLHAFFDFDPEVQSFFDSIGSVNLSVVSVAYKQSLLKKRGFGYLIPSDQGEEVLGVVFDSCVFPEQNQTPHETRLTVMLGGAHHPQFDPSKAREKALTAIHEHLGIDASPDYCHVTHYPHAIPQYYVGHDERVMAFESLMKKRYPHITCIGNALHGASINQCVKTASSFFLEK